MPKCKVHAVCLLCQNLKFEEGYGALSDITPGIDAYFFCSAEDCKFHGEKATDETLAMLYSRTCDQWVLNKSLADS